MITWVETSEDTNGERMALGLARRNGAIMDICSLWLTRLSETTGYVHLDKLDEGDEWECIYHSQSIGLHWRNAEGIYREIQGYTTYADLLAFVREHTVDG